MICTRCLLRSRSTIPRATLPSGRQFSSALNRLSPQETATLQATPATSTSAAQPFSTPLSPTPNPISLGTALKPKSKAPAITSSCIPGTPLKGLNYLKGRDDPIALAEEEYPDWLWKCLDKKEVDVEGEGEGDEFSKSKKLRRASAKRQRKAEALRLASGAAAPEVRIPLTQQSVDLPANEEGTTRGAIVAGEKREEVRGAMRRERRGGIKEKNFLKGM